MALALPATLPGPGAAKASTDACDLFICGEAAPSAVSCQAYQEASSDGCGEELGAPVGLDLPRQRRSRVPLFCLVALRLPGHGPSVFRPPDQQ